MVGAGVSAAQNYNQGQIANAQAKNQAAIMQYQSDEAGRAGTQDYNRYTRQVQQILGRQRAAIGASNLQDSGSPLAVQEDTAAIGTEDALNIAHQTALDAYGIRIGKADVLAQGAAAKRAAGVAAFNSLVQGASQAYGTGIYSKAGAGIKSLGTSMRGKKTPGYLDSPILNSDRYYG